MNVMDADHWYAVQARPGAEEVARLSLESLDLETFLPRSRRRCRVGGMNRLLVRPLFTGYLFARFCAERHLSKVRYCRGVCRIVSAGVRPAPVDEEIIAEIRDRAEEDGYVPLQRQTLRRGDPVTVNTGPLSGWQGVFDAELDDRGRVVILLQSILAARVVLDEAWLSNG